MTNLEDLFRNGEKLTAKQRSIVNYIMSKPDEAAYLTLKELSARAGASEVSVLRLCRAVGLESFVELKQALRDYNSEQLRLAAPRVFSDGKEAEEMTDPRDVIAAACEDDVFNMRSMLSGLNKEALLSCAQGLLEAGEVAVFAHDASFLFADYLSYRLNFLRIKCTSFQLGNSDTIPSALARLEKNDWMILLSFPPYHQPIRKLVDFCRYKGIRVITITDSMESPAAVPDASVFLCRTATRFFYNSQCTTLSLINALASCIAYLLGPRFQDILEEEKEVSNFIFTSYTSGQLPE